MARIKVRKLKGFTAELKHFGKVLLPETFVDFQKWVALELFKRILKKTPVDKNFLRGSWTITVNSQDRIPANKSSGASNGAAMTPAEQATFINGVNAMSDLKIGQVIWINNAMPYVLRIEFDGHSKEKAPRGMVQISINELKNWLKTSKSEFVKITKRSF